jgi:peptidoglycan/LPS O-acetylase OafA/YrhL
MSGAAMKYRPDIDGLRALAIIAIMVFHFKIN